MKRILLAIVLLILAFTASCEVDDICTSNTLTPKLIVRFYDDVVTDSITKVDSLYVWRIDRDTIYNHKTIDSIALPFDIQNESTTYILNTGYKTDTLYLHHENNEIYVSRSCGYKYNFSLLNTTYTTHNWIVSEELNTPQTIENEQNAHIKIYH